MHRFYPLGAFWCYCGYRSKRCIMTIPLIVAVASSLAIMSLWVGLYRLMRPAGELDSRLAQLSQHEKSIRQKPNPAFLSNLLKGSILEQKLGGKVALELAQADIALTVTEFVSLRIVGAVLGFGVGLLILHNLLFGLALILLGLQLPIFFLHRRSGQRQRRFQSQLVDVISMLVSGLRAGVGLVQAMDLVRQEMPAPAGTEFGRVVREIGLGASLEEALDHLLERMPGDDLGMIITVINIQAEVGGNLATVLDGVITTIRERVRIAQEIRTLTAQQRIAGYMLAGMPFLVGGAIMMINPDFMQPLLSPQWIWLPGMAVGLIVVGFLVINRIVNIKV